ncbi:MAG TPA: hypothetical protein VEB21_04620, partial [Terriglobales bacterium]|nr:hypothetical protein [Terriglobales bacterium]
LAMAGTYTVIVGNQAFLTAPDPFDPQDEGDFAGYTLFAQKCPAAGSFTGATMNSRFAALDCVAEGDVPLRSFLFNGTAEQLLTLRLQAADLGVKLALVEPSGNRVEASTDPFAPEMAGARINRLLPQTGTYAIEATLQPEIAVNPANLPFFTLLGTTCASRAVSAGTISDSFTAGDCNLGDGRRFDGFRLAPGASPVAVSVDPPASVCLLGLLGDGSVVPSGGCTSGLLEFPMSTSGSYALMSVAATSATMGTYEMPLRLCPTSRTTFPQRVEGSVNSSVPPTDCADAAGDPADWILVSAPAGLVHYTESVSGVFEDLATTGATLLLRHGATETLGPFSAADTEMFPLGSELSLLVKVGGAGSYRLILDPPLRVE